MVQWSFRWNTLCCEVAVSFCCKADLASRRRLLRSIHPSYFWWFSVCFHCTHLFWCVSSLDRNAVKSLSLVVGVAFLVGYFSDSAFAKLNEIADTFFGASHAERDTKRKKTRKRNRNRMTSIPRQERECPSRLAVQLETSRPYMPKSAIPKTRNWLKLNLGR